MRRYIGLAVGVGLVVAALSASGALPAAAQEKFKPVLAMIINDATQPVPVTGTIQGTLPQQFTGLPIKALCEEFAVLMSGKKDVPPRQDRRRLAGPHRRSPEQIFSLVELSGEISVG